MNNKSVTSLSLRKLILSALVAAPLATLPTQLWALPSTASSNVTSTAGTNTTYSTSGSTLTITTPDRTVLSWTAFGSGSSTIGASDTVSYVLPSSSAGVLNMVTGGAATTIDGTLTSNGQIFVLNPAGIVLSSTGKITASATALSTAPETEYNFLASGNLAYSGTPTNDVSALGTIKVGQSGNIALVGRNVTVGGTIDAGTLNVTANTGTVALNGGLIVGSTSSNYGNVAITTSGTNVDLGATGGSIIISGGSLTVNTNAGNATAGGAVGQTNTGLNIGNGVNAGGLTINTKGSSSSGAVTLTGVQGTGGSQLNVGVTGGATSITDTQGDIQLNTSTASSLSVTANTGNIKSGGNVTAATVSLSAATAGKNIAYTASGNTTFSAINSNATGDVTLLGSGTISVPAFTAGSTTLGGTNLTQTGSLTISGIATIQASGNATLNNTSNDFGSVVVKGVTGNAVVYDNNNVTIGNGTNVTGNLTVTSVNNGITLGNASSDTITVGGALVLNASGATAGTVTVADLTDNATVLGNLTITAGTDDIKLDGSTGTGAGLKSQYGAVSIISAGNATLGENTTLNLGAITVAGNLNAYSNTSIINTGQLKVPGTLSVGAGTGTSPGSVALTFSASTVGNGNQIANIRVLTDSQLLGSSTLGYYLASSLSVTNESGFAGLTIPTNTYGLGLQGNVTLTDVASAGIAPGVLVLNGGLTLNEGATGTGTAAINVAGANQFGSVTVNTAGAVTAVNSTIAYTANATLKGGAVAAAFSSGDALTLGSITSSDTGAVTFTATKGITDSVGSISIYGPVTFAGSSVSITKSGNNFGGITATTTGNGTVTIVESGTSNYLGVNTGTGAFTATSQNGNIIQGTGTTGIIVAGNVSLNALNGAVTANDATHNNITGAIAVNAKSDSVLTNLGNTVLDNSTVSAGGLSVTIAAASNLDQKSGTKIYTYGNTTFSNTGSGTGNITIANSGNQFGGLTLTSGAGNIAITEATTMNLKSVSNTGTFAATSEQGSIIDSGSGTLVPGTATFTAANGNITLGLSGSNYTNVSFVSGGNVSVKDGVSDISLGNTTVGGTLTVTNTSGNILETGTLLITGASTFNASATGSQILLLNNNNQFGGLSFTAGTAGAIINEFTTLNLKGGSKSTGPVTLGTGGNFITSGTGASTFSYVNATTPSLTINATGTIIPGAGSLAVTNGLVVSSPSAKDLSGLSLSGNLNSVAPTNQGTGSYVAPSP